MFLLLEIIPLILLLQSFAFALSIYFNRNCIADVFWGLGIALIAIYCTLRLGHGTYPTLVIGALTAIWGLRLTWHIGTRFIQKKTEDPRYAAMSQNWSAYYLRSYLQVFVLQGLLMVAMSAAIITTVIHPQVFSFYWLPLGVVIWLLGFIIEVIADWQLTQFVKTKKPGQIMQRGLWRYSRHPNYFGEVLLWWGLWLITIPTPYWYLTIITPLTITFLILKVSGVPMAKERYKNNKAFQAYAARTNKFFMWWPK